MQSRRVQTPLGRVAMPSGPGVIDEALIAEICAYAGDRAETFADLQD